MHTPCALPLTRNALTVLEKRYLKRDENGLPAETPEEMFRRVAETVAGADSRFGRTETGELAEDFYAAMTGLEFLPNSPTLMNAGRELGQLSACFVLPVGDSIEEIFDAVKHTALIHKSGGGTGFSFSRLRPARDMVRSTSGISSGPLSFMRVFDTATETIKQGGTRRGANMAILSVDHPDIMDFIMSKDDQTQFNNFNISIGLTEAFMAAVDCGGEYDLLNPRTGLQAGKINAEKVFRRIVAQAWKNGEPGIVFLDRINRGNPTPQAGAIESTNPCGEQPLLPYESCNLGSVNLGPMVRHGEVDWDSLRRVARLAVHFLDNVVEINNYPLPQIRATTLANRKIGLGVMGWADLLLRLGLPYDSDAALELGGAVMKFIREEGCARSRELAAERGSFPNFPGSVHDRPGAGGMRNATVTTIAPTGTISIIAGASSGIEPLFAVSYVRHAMGDTDLVESHPYFEQVARERGFASDDLMRKIAEQGGVKNLPDVPDDLRRVFVTAHDIAPEWHVRMQAAFQQHTDNAVSKTVNFPASAASEDVEAVFRLAYRLKCKGVTIYRDGSRDEQVLSRGTGPAKPEDRSEEAGKAVKRERPKALNGWTYQMQTGCGALYITINQDRHGLFELFTTMGKAGGCAASQCEAIGRMVSLAWRSGVQARQVVKQLAGISCHSPAGFGEQRLHSCADAVARAIEMHLRREGASEAPDREKPSRGACPECGGRIDYQEGCAKCRDCSYSECG